MRRTRWVSNGRWRAGPAVGYYDSNGRWVPTAASAGALVLAKPSCANVSVIRRLF